MLLQNVNEKHQELTETLQAEQRFLQAQITDCQTRQRDFLEQLSKRTGKMQVDRVSL